MRSDFPIYYENDHFNQDRRTHEAQETYMLSSHPFSRGERGLTQDRPTRSVSQPDKSVWPLTTVSEVDRLSSRSPTPYRDQRSRSNSCQSTQTCDLGPAHIDSSTSLVAPGRETNAVTRRHNARCPFPGTVYMLSLIQVAVFIAELVKYSQLTGSVVETKPSFNPMIGPSPYLIINMGGRYVPCMRNVHGIQDQNANVLLPCPNQTAGLPSCLLSELCGFGGVPNPHPGGNLQEKPAPDQWFRFITPIFLHGGFIHIGSNLLLQLTMGSDVERAVGSIRFILVYFASGIFGFVMGGNFAPDGLVSSGCSGSLFGVIALSLLDLLYTWKEQRRPVLQLSTILIVVIVMWIIGLLPTGLDNFSHIGGFVMGLALGIGLLRSPNAFSWWLDSQDTNNVSGKLHKNSMFAAANVQLFGTQGAQRPVRWRKPSAFFSSRRRIWWLWSFIRIGALITVLTCFILLLDNFYKGGNRCSWCRYLSCINVNGWCNIGQITALETSNS